MTQTTGSTPTANAQLVRQFLEALDQQKFDEVESLISPDFKLYFGGHVLEREQFMPLVRSVYTSFADFRHEIQELFAVDDRVVMRCIDRGTHVAEFEGVPGSGRQINIGQISLFRVAAGKVVEIREEADMLGLMQQIGAIPATTA